MYITYHLAVPQPDDTCMSYTRPHHVMPMTSVARSQVRVAGITLFLFHPHFDYELIDFQITSQRICLSA